jgi:hypothetical protein
MINVEKQIDRQIPTDNKPFTILAFITVDVTKCQKMQYVIGNPLSTRM